MPHIFATILRVSSFSRYLPKRCITSDKQDYELALQKLNSLQSNAKTVALAKDQGPLSHVQQLAKVEATTKYLSRIGISLESLDTLSVVHIAGTKGKGTTAALCESILRRHGYRTGFFSSPHLVEARERIRLDGNPISHRHFADDLNYVYERLSAKRESDVDMPAYFKFLTVMAFHVFLRERVDVAIIEVGIGGEYDCTNCIRRPTVVGITTLGLDHTSILGNTLPDIAWQKAGVMKPGCQAFTVPQSSPAAMDVLRERAANRQCSLSIAPPLSSYTWERSLTASMGFTNMIEDAYSSNASLALQLANAWLNSQSPFREQATRVINSDSETVPVANACHVTELMAAGLEACSWPGRTQLIRRDNVTYFLDGAHTEDSIAYCIQWFLKTSTTLQQDPEQARRVLIFNTTGPRASDQFLAMLTACQFESALFPAIVPFPNTTDTSDHFSKLSEDKISTLKNLSNIWRKIDSNRNSQVFTSMSEAVDWLKGRTEQYHVLVTGSVHLVGCALAVLDPHLTEPVTRISSTLLPLHSIYATLQAAL